MLAQALENGTTLVLCNRVGQESLPRIQADFLGKSMVCAPFGQLLADGKEGAEDAQGAWVEQSPRAVSYTHLDVYKRQVRARAKAKRGRVKP